MYHVSDKSSGNICGSPSKAGCISTKLTLRLRPGPLNLLQMCEVAVELIQRRGIHLDDLLVLALSPHKVTQDPSSLVNHLTQLGFTVNWTKTAQRLSTVYLLRHTAEHCRDAPDL